MNNLISKINNKKAVIGILGLGYVGLDLLLLFAKNKYHCFGFDKDLSKIKKLKKNISYINYIKNSEIKANRDYTIFNNTFENLKKCDIILICVPTPLTDNKTPELSYIQESVKEIKKNLRKNQLIVLESTTFPGTTEEYIVDNFSKQFQIGKNLFIGYSPERIDPGSKIETSAVPKIVSGFTKNCLKITNTFYKVFFKTVKVKDLKTAEITKLYENIYRSVNIGLVNEMKIICDRMNIDIHSVIEAAKTKPYGFSAFYPGPGLGGHCVPIDPYYLSWKVKSINLNTRFIELAAEINGKMPNWVVNKIQEIFIKNKINFFSSKILILGLSYKKNINDLRESPSIEIFNILKKLKIEISVFDGYCNTNEIKKNFRGAKIFKNFKKINFKKFTAVLIITDHDNFDYQTLIKKSKIVIDTRGKLKKIKSKKIFLI